MDNLHAGGLAADIDTQGWAARPVLRPEECETIAAYWRDAERFRKAIVMEHHAYGRGEYRYFTYPLPDPVQALRTALYRPLAAVANGWRAALGEAGTYPEALTDYLDRCHASGQTRPTPLMLHYGPGDFNCLHQDVYGEHVFPLQAVILLSDPGRDFTGGEFLLVEQRPRAQSRAEIVPLRQGDVAIFPVRYRPARGTRGPYRLTMRHGVSRVRSGTRQTLGLIFHDAA